VSEAKRNRGFSLRFVSREPCAGAAEATTKFTYKIDAYCLAAEVDKTTGKELA